MNQWVILSICVLVAAAISAQPLSRLRKPEKNDKLKICLSVAIILAAAVLFWSRPNNTLNGGGVKYLRQLSVYRGGAQCTLPQAGAGYQPYVVPKDLTVGGGQDDFVITVPDMTIKPTYSKPAGVPKFVEAAQDDLSDVVVGSTLRLVGDF